MTDVRQLLLDDGMAIDQRKTAGRVRNFFEHDFERYLGYAGLNPVDLSVIDDSHLSSPKMDASGVSAHGGVNHQEDSTLRIIEAEKACHAVGKAIDNCRDSARTPYRTILREHYLKGLDDQKVMVLLGYEHSWYDSLKRQQSASLPTAGTNGSTSTAWTTCETCMFILQIKMKADLKRIESGKIAEAVRID